MHNGVMESSTNSSDIFINYGVCRDMLIHPIQNTRLTYWNLALLLPNAVFLVFLSYHIGLFNRLFHQKQFPVLKVLLVLIFFVCVVGVIKVFAATIATTNPEKRLPNEILWLLQRFLLLAVEISVIGFGLLSGYGRGDGVGKRVVSLSFFIALVYTTIQTSLEFFTYHRTKVFKSKYMMFHHGGMVFWCISSTLFFLIYSLIVILPTVNCLCGRGFLSLPSNRAFYRYAAMLCVVNLLQGVGSLLVYNSQTFGLCILNVSVLVYYSLYAPLVYFTFLRKGFRYLRNNLSSLSYGNLNDAEDARDSSSSRESYETVVV